MKFKKGNLIATLKLTQKENHKYKWVPCLALLLDDGSWAYSGSWRSNAWKKAQKEIKSIGYELIE